MTNDSTAPDRQLLHDYCRETRDPYVQRLLAELLGHVNRAGFERTAGAGGGNTRDLGQGQYAVSYAYTPDTTRADHLAVLVHELTHVAVNQAYGSRMLNFPVPPLSAAEENRVRDETPGREEDFQNAALRRADARRRDAYVDLVIGNVQRLLDELRGSGLPAERQRAIRTKLTDHMRARPYHEYDGVLSHVLTWSDLDGSPPVLGLLPQPDRDGGTGRPTGGRPATSPCRAADAVSSVGWGGRWPRPWECPGGDRGRLSLRPTPASAPAPGKAFPTSP
ncbi:hypothetical protein SRIMM317S_04049 [Streptomyces rimosus subsp. rimosus]